MNRTGLSSTLVLLCCSQAWAMDGKGALAYVATNGRLCGPRLQQALRDYRQACPQSTVSDPELAVAIASQG